MVEHTTGGNISLAELADQHKTQPSSILRLTAEHSPGGAYPANVAAYINGVFTGSIAHDGHRTRGYTSTCPPDPGARRPRAVGHRPGLPRPAYQESRHILSREGPWWYCHRQWQRTACPLPSQRRPAPALATRTRVHDSRASPSGQVTYLGGQTRAVVPHEPALERGYTPSPVADLPLDLPGGLADRLAHALDQEGQDPRALEALGPLGGREVALVDAAGGVVPAPWRCCRLGYGPWSANRRGVRRAGPRSPT